jgi:hypothetical protein
MMFECILIWFAGSLVFVLGWAAGSTITKRNHELEAHELMMRMDRIREHAMDED